MLMVAVKNKYTEIKNDKLEPHLNKKYTY